MSYDRVCLYMTIIVEPSKEEWVISQNYYGENGTLCNFSSASIISGVNPLFLEGLL